MICIRKTGRFIAALAATALICCGCGEQDTQRTVSEEKQSVALEEAESADAEVSAKKEETAMSIEEVYKEIEQKVSLKSPVCMDEDFIFNYYGIDVTGLEEYVFSISEDAAQAETVIIMKTKDAEDSEEIAACLETVVEEKKEEMENYIPEQFKIVEKSKVVTKDNYVWLVISENEDSITDIIENGLL